MVFSLEEVWMKSKIALKIEGFAGLFPPLPSFKVGRKKDRNKSRRDPKHRLKGTSVPAKTVADLSLGSRILFWCISSLSLSHPKDSWRQFAKEILFFSTEWTGSIFFRSPILETWSTTKTGQKKKQKTKKNEIGEQNFFGGRNSIGLAFSFLRLYFFFLSKWTCC